LAVSSESPARTSSTFSGVAVKNTIWRIIETPQHLHPI
jgi:hypothetical protein